MNSSDFIFIRFIGRCTT